MNIHQLISIRRTIRTWVCSPLSFQLLGVWHCCITTLLPNKRKKASRSCYSKTLIGSFVGPANEWGVNWVSPAFRPGMPIKNISYTTYSPLWNPICAASTGIIIITKFGFLLFFFVFFHTKWCGTALLKRKCLWTNSTFLYIAFTNSSRSFGRLATIFAALDISPKCDVYIFLKGLEYLILHWLK